MQIPKLTEGDLLEILWHDAGRVAGCGFRHPQNRCLINLVGDHAHGAEANG